MERIKKFNGGACAILCNGCSIIIKEGMYNNVWAVAYHKQKGTYPDGIITQEDWDSDEPIYCEKCKKIKNKQNK